MKMRCSLFLVSLFLITHCGGGGGGGGTDVDTLLSEAYAALQDADIDAAAEAYDEILADDPDNATGAFGAAFVRMIQLSESTPSQQILEGLGYETVAIEDLIGSESFLADVNTVNEATVTLDGFTGPFYGRVRIMETGTDCRRTTAEFQFRDAETASQLDLILVLSVVDGDDSYTLAEGDTVEIGNELAFDNCSPSVVSAVMTTANGRFNSYSDLSSGSITVNQISQEEGGALSIDLSEVILLNDDQSLILNGSLTDVVNEAMPDPENYFPVFGQDGSLGEFLAHAQDGLTSSDFQSYLEGYVPLMEEIGALLEVADQEDGFQFTVPKELYFGGEDVAINRTDLKLLRAGIHFTLSGLYLSNSWELPLEVGALFDENGQLLLSKAEIVDELNGSFSLKSAHKMAEAETEFTEGIQLVMGALDSVSTVTADGVVDEADDTSDGFAELEDVVQTVQESLDGPVTFAYADPSVEVDLGRFFSDPPEPDDVDTDPFVLEDGKIKPVELFFKEVLEGVVDFELNTNYRHAFTALRGTFSKSVFDEFGIFFVAGDPVGTFGANLPEEE